MAPTPRKHSHQYESIWELLWLLGDETTISEIIYCTVVFTDVYYAV